MKMSLKSLKEHGSKWLAKYEPYDLRIEVRPNKDGYFIYSFNYSSQCSNRVYVNAKYCPEDNEVYGVPYGHPYRAYQTVYAAMKFRKENLLHLNYC